MKKVYLIFLLITALGMGSCNYLDIVPDETAKAEDAWKDTDAARRFLYSCYSFIPDPHNGTSSLDFMTGDEVISHYEQEDFANFPKGNFTAANPGISYWNTIYNGIRQCYMLQENLKSVPGLDQSNYDDFIAQSNFLLGYYHLLLMRCYGPVIVVRGVVDVNTDPDLYQAREPLKDVVAFITECFDKAAEVLPPKRTNATEVGLATSVAAKALKAYTLMYYASPLFNGGDVCKQLAKDLVNADGTKLMDADEDGNRWVVARDAYKDAIVAAEAAGHRLFDATALESKDMDNPYPENDLIRLMRANEVTIVKYNPEEIWTIKKDENQYGIQKKCMPYVKTVAYSGIGLTMNMLNRFYTRNGLPYDVDPETKDLNRFDVINLNAANSQVKFVYPDTVSAVIAEEGWQTPQINLNREPRYYAWVAFHGAFFEVTNAAYNPGYTDESAKKYDGKQVVCNFMKGMSCGYHAESANDYSPSGTLNKKGVHPDNQVATNTYTLKQFPFPIIRLAELYLGYAECSAECAIRSIGDGDNANIAKTYVDKIRHRAGIPGVDESWRRVGGIKDNTQLRDIIRNERQIELYLECQNFWDMRRWELAKQYFDQVPHGFNMNNGEVTDVSTYSRDVEIAGIVRAFRDAHWLLPIPSQDINNNHNVIQNPGY